MEHYIIHGRHQWHISIIEVRYSRLKLSSMWELCQKARVTLVHPAQANTKLCGNPYAYPSKILCCFPANRAIYTQNKQQFDEPFEFWALLFVT